MKTQPGHITKNQYVCTRQLPFYKLKVSIGENVKGRYDPPKKKKKHKRVSSTHPGNFMNGKDRNGGRGICYRIWSYIPNEIASSPVWIYKCK
jgi:hypothetical protein